MTKQKPITTNDVTELWRTSDAVSEIGVKIIAGGDLDSGTLNIGSKDKNDAGTSEPYEEGPFAVGDQFIFTVGKNRILDATTAGGGGSLSITIEVFEV